MKTKEEIKKLLNKYPPYKNSDSRLMAHFWAEEISKKNIDINKITARDFLKMFAKSQLTNPETIRRMRAKIQEESPEYRGKVYKFRKEKKQQQWREKLGYNTSCSVPRNHTIGSYDEY